VQESNRVAVLTSGLWKERFGGEPGVIGKNITLDGQTYTVIGVVAHQPSLDFATDSRLWIPFIPSKDQLAARENHAYSVVARMKSGASLERAQGELDTISARLATSYPGSDKGWTIHATSLKHFCWEISHGVPHSFFAVGFVLLIACANVSNFFLARGWARRGNSQSAPR
jgi:putative ABC transport system permease protein